MWARCRELIYSSSTPLSTQCKEINLKVLVIGEAYAGKTSFITRYVHQKFNKAYRATVGVDFAMKMIQFDARTNIKLQLWDIAGQERFADMTRVYYKDGVGACIATDISKPANLEKVLRWKSDLDNKVLMPDGSKVPCLLLANKCDLLLQEAMKEKEESLNDFCKQNGFLSWFYTSSMSNVNIEESMTFLINEIMTLKNVEQKMPKTESEEQLIKLDIKNNNIAQLSNGHIMTETEDSKCFC